MICSQRTLIRFYLSNKAHDLKKSLLNLFLIRSFPVRHDNQ